MPIPFRQRISVRLMVVAVACGFSLGLVLSVNQIWLDYREQSRTLRATMTSTLDLLREPATEAVYNFDAALAQQLVRGLAGRDDVYEAHLLALPAERLADFRRPRAASPWRRLTDAFFGEQELYDVALTDARTGNVIGHLHVGMDTYQAGRAFLDRALVILLTGVARSALLALLLLLVFTRWLTRPLTRLVEQVARVNPGAPGRLRLARPEGHEHDELGAWVDGTNALLQSVEEELDKRLRAEHRAAYASQFDRLTDLPNRALFQDRGSQALQRAQQRGGHLAVLVCDIRDFHAFNEHHGAAAGDEVLQRFAEAVREAVPAGLTVARLAGDRFGVLQDVGDRVDPVASLAQTVIECAAGPLRAGARTHSLAVAIGIAVYPDDGRTLDDVLQNAEKALRQAKLGRQSQYQFYYAEMGTRIRERKLMERDLEGALAAGELTLHYQPQFELRDGRMTGVEALMRWNSARRGPVPPAAFVPLAEETGLIVPIGRWALREACREALAWRVPLPLRLAVNVSSVQLQGSDFCGDMMRILEETRFPAAALEIELTETAAMTDIGRMQATLGELKAAGVQVALDDFGTGHASLSQLRRVPADRLKIDRSFVHDVHRDSGKASIVRAIISLGHNLGHQVTAEGVERPEELAYLRRNGCDEMQGYVCCPPVAASELGVRIRSGAVLEPDQRRYFTAAA